MTKNSFVAEVTVSNIRVRGTKIGYAKHYHQGETAAKIRNVATSDSAAHIKQKRCVTYMAGYNNSRALYIASSESCQPNRNLFGIGTKLK